jgi:hypothetical protein
VAEITGLMGVNVVKTPKGVVKTPNDFGLGVVKTPKGVVKTPNDNLAENLWLWIGLFKVPVRPV